MTKTGKYHQNKERHKHRRECNLCFTFKIQKQNYGNYLEVCCPHFPTPTLKLPEDLNF